MSAAAPEETQSSERTGGRARNSKRRNHNNKIKHACAVLLRCVQWRSLMSSDDAAVQQHIRIFQEGLCATKPPREIS